MRAKILWVPVVAVISCTPLTEAGERVRVVDDASAVKGCKYVGRVEGSGRNNAPGEKIGGNALIAETNAENEARNRAGELGADTLLDLETEQGHFSAEASGRAYRCRSSTEATASK